MVKAARTPGSRSDTKRASRHAKRETHYSDLREKYGKSNREIKKGMLKPVRELLMTAAELDKDANKQYMFVDNNAADLAKANRAQAKNLLNKKTSDPVARKKSKQRKMMALAQGRFLPKELLQKIAEFV